MNNTEDSDARSFDFVNEPVILNDQFADLLIADLRDDAASHRH